LFGNCFFLDTLRTEYGLREQCIGISHESALAGRIAFLLGSALASHSYKDRKLEAGSSILLLAFSYNLAPLISHLLALVSSSATEIHLG